MKTEIASAVWQEIRGPFEEARRLIDAEIRAYPPPIPACDAQFNHLMAQRARLTRDLGRLDNAADGHLVGDDAAVWLAEFLESATYLEDAARRRIEQQALSAFER